MRLIVWLFVLCSWSSVQCGQCPSDVLLMYKMVLRTEWSEETFPKQYPEWRPPAQWSVVLGRSHNSSAVLWRTGNEASDALRSFVESGGADLFVRGGKIGVFSEFFAPPLPKGVGTAEAQFFIDQQHPKVSIICRLIPSPDWFIGVDSFNFCKGGKWLDIVSLDLWPQDAGTDSGFTFTAPNWATSPRENIRQISTKDPDHPAASFNYPDRDTLPRIATVTFFKHKEFRLASQAALLQGESLVLDRKPDSSLLSKPTNEVKQLSLKEERRKRKEKKKRKMRSEEVGPFPPETETNAKRKMLQKKQHYKSKWCLVSEWSEWSKCSKRCGFGEQKRKRSVLKFGGLPCPPLLETKWCRGRDTCNTTSPPFRWQ